MGFAPAPPHPLGHCTQALAGPLTLTAVLSGHVAVQALLPAAESSEAPQAMQAEAPVAGCALPAGQGRHPALLPARENFPAAQMAGETRPGLLQLAPALQARQAEPADWLYEPVAQMAQAEGGSALVPAGQVVAVKAHAVEACAEKLPAGHGAQLVRLTASVPAGHAAQGAPGLAETWPEGHALHCAAEEAPATLVVPASQGTQAAPPCSQ